MFICISLTHAAAVFAEPDVLERPALDSERAPVSVLLAVTRADKRLVAVGERGIIVLSDDNGAMWRQAKVPVSVSLTNVRFSTGSSGWATGHGGVVLHSADGGETWVKQLDGKQVARIILEAAKAGSVASGKDLKNAVADADRLVADGPDKPFLDVHFFDNDNGLIVGAFGLILSTRNGGKTWQPGLDRIDNTKGKHLYSIHVAGSDVYLAGEQGAVFRSRDGGKTFSELRTPYSGTYFGILTAAPKVAIAFGLRGNAYWSGDEGASWQKTATGTPSTITAGLLLADGSLVLVDEGGRVLRSRDGGRGFKPLRTSQHSSFTGVVQSSDGGLILSGVRGITKIAPDTLLAESLQ
jgi:photosystem II stability/assembly factor-like uncharacterized protein